SKHTESSTNPKCCSKFFKIIFVVLAIITTLKAIGVIAISIMTAIATKVYDQEQSGRLVALIVVAVTAAVTVAITIYAVVAVFTKKNRPIHAAAIVLIVLALIQAIIAGTAIRVTNEDQIHLGRALTDSFRLAKEHNPRNVKMWAATQHNLNCCGMYGPEDYRPSNVPSYFPPDVPISCCPAYDPNRSDLVQERDREICKARKNFNDIGCKYLVLDMYVDSSSLALSVIIGLIILEIFEVNDDESFVCEIKFWRGCPTGNLFNTEYHCSHHCIGRLWSSEQDAKVESFSKTSLVDTLTVTYYGCPTENKFRDEEECQDICEKSEDQWEHAVKEMDLDELRKLNNLLDNVKDEFETEKENLKKDVKKSKIVPHTVPDDGVTELPEDETNKIDNESKEPTEKPEKPTDEPVAPTDKTTITTTEEESETKAETKPAVATTNSVHEKGTEAEETTKLPVSTKQLQDYCSAPLNKSDCGLSPTPVFSYYKPGSICKIAMWRGCPTRNKFDAEYECSNFCIGNAAEEINKCDVPLNTNACTKQTTEVFTFSKAKQTCVEALWHGCPSLNKFDDKLTCVEACHNDNTKREWMDKLKKLDINSIKGMHNVLDEIIKKGEPDMIRENDIIEESNKKNQEIDAETNYVKTLEEISKISGVSLK
ncbi:hypothetical protein MSG28_003646, partial [Choristoneura fumiferana]